MCVCIYVDKLVKIDKTNQKLNHCNIYDNY